MARRVGRMYGGLRVARARLTPLTDAMQNAKKAMPSASVVSGVLKALVYGGAGTYGLYNRCVRRRSRVRARACASKGGD